MDAVKQPLELGQVVGVLDPGTLDRGGETSALGRNSCNGGVEQTDRDREAGDGGEDGLKVLLLEREQLGKRVAA